MNSDSALFFLGVIAQSNPNWVSVQSLKKDAL